MNLRPDWGHNGYCTSKFVVAHEFVHGFGIWHEHQRADRDDYVSIDFDNIKKGFKHAFDKCTKCETYNVSYDPFSIMHYHAYSYCKDCSKVTIKSKVSGIDTIT